MKQGDQKKIYSKKQMKGCRTRNTFRKGQSFWSSSVAAR